MKKIISALIPLVGLFFLLSLPALPASAQSTISIGQYLQLGSYNGEPILWRCVDIDEHGPLMLSDRILTAKAFDAAGKHPNDPGENRLSGGSNLWKTSNIRAWLNSTDGAGKVEWPCGNPPATELSESGARRRRWRAEGNYNAYDSEQGFLADGNFTESERALIKTVKQTSLLNNKDRELATAGSEPYYYHHNVSYQISLPLQNYDAAYKHHVTDKMFLLDLMQIHKVNQNLGNYYMARPTKKAVAKSDYEGAYFDDARTWHYWLRSPASGRRVNHNVRYVTSAGYLFHVKASSSYIGVRPAFYINLSSVTFRSGDGSAENPYSFQAPASSPASSPDSAPDEP